MVGISSIYYHGRIIDPDIKVEHALVWLEDEVQLICCTNAFGMDIDKPDVRFVIHYSMPNSLENLVQEAGRAGRDGDTAQCILMYRFGDRSFHLRNISESNSENIKIKRLASLNTISEYTAQKGCCRQKFIASYFGDQSEETCEICDICQSTTVLDSVDVGGDVKGLLKCLRSMLLLKDKVTKEELVLTYIGSQSSEVRRHHFENVKEYGHGKGKWKSAALHEMVHLLVIKCLVKENLRDINDRAKSIYLTLDLSPGLMRTLNSMQVYDIDTVSCTYLFYRYAFVCLQGCQLCLFNKSHEGR